VLHLLWLILLRQQRCPHRRVGVVAGGEQPVQLVLGGHVPSNDEVPTGRVVSTLDGDLTPEGLQAGAEVHHAVAEPGGAVRHRGWRTAVHGREAAAEAAR
jgi:hypothetical protein